MAVFTLADAADTVDVSIQKMWIKRPVKDPEKYKMIANVETGIDDYYTKDSSISDLGFAGRITENASVVAEDPVQGYDKTWTQVEYGLMLAVTKMM